MSAKRIFLVLAVVLGAYTSYANVTVNINPSVEESKVKKGDYISVSDRDGVLIYTGNVNRTGQLFSLYDFSELKNGIYSVEIDSAFEIEKYTIEIKNHTVVYNKTNKKKVFKPVFRVEDSNVIISRFMMDTKKATIEIYYEDQIIHTEIIHTNSPILNKVYKLDASIGGDYMVVVKTDAQVFSKNFKM